MADIQDPAGLPARLSITQTSSDGIRVLTLGGEIDADTVGGLREALCFDGTATSSRTVLDFGAVTFMDSSGVNVLVAAFHKSWADGDWIRMAAPIEPVWQVVDIVGLDAIIPCYPTLPEALAA
ncbi:STAS domain-containing protein [Streptomyces sp. NPDC060085]|uniref:STAS domain-containing protein n=1 Tax=Streptomyces sp. NPDC060085 TaxID=3347054 RepID=UPI003652EDB5